MAAPVDLPVEVWQRIFEECDVKDVLLLSNMVSKALRAAMSGAIVEFVSLQRSVPSYVLADQALLRRIVLPMGCFGDLYFACGNSLRELELGRHDPIDLVTLSDALPRLKRLHLGQISLISSLYWYFLPRSLEYLALRRLEKASTVPRDTSAPLPAFFPSSATLDRTRLASQQAQAQTTQMFPETQEKLSQNGLPSPFVGMPRTLQSLSIMQYCPSDRTYNKPFYGDLSSLSSLELATMKFQEEFKASDVFLDFYLNAYDFMPNLRRLDLPDYLTLSIGCAQWKSLNPAEYTLVAHRDPPADTSKPLQLLLPHLEQLSCYQILLTNNHPSRLATPQERQTRNESSYEYKLAPVDFSFAPALTSLDVGYICPYNACGSYDRTDRQAWLDHDYNGVHLHSTSGAYPPRHRPQFEGRLLPPTLTSLHIHERYSGEPTSLPPRLVFLSFPGVPPGAYSQDPNSDEITPLHQLSSLRALNITGPVSVTNALPMKLPSDSLQLLRFFQTLISEPRPEIIGQPHFEEGPSLQQFKQFVETGKDYFFDKDELEEISERCAAFRRAFPNIPWTLVGRCYYSTQSYGHTPQHVLEHDPRADIKLHMPFMPWKGMKSMLVPYLFEREILHWRRILFPLRTSCCAPESVLNDGPTRPTVRPHMMALLLDHPGLYELFRPLGVYPDHIPRLRYLLSLGLDPSSSNLLAMASNPSVLRLLILAGVFGRPGFLPALSSPLPPTPTTSSMSRSTFNLFNAFMATSIKSDWLRVCIEYGIDLNQQNDLKRTWLHLAIEKRCTLEVDLLLNAKRAVSPPTSSAPTAGGRRYEYLVRIDLADVFGMTQMQEALKCGYEAIERSMKSRIIEAELSEINNMTQQEETWSKSSLQPSLLPPSASSPWSAGAALSQSTSTQGNQVSLTAKERRKWREEDKWEAQNQ